jgi:SnoaL-like protein
VDRSKRLEALCAKDDIRDCLSRHARGVDRVDRDLLRGAYWPDATESHAGRYDGPAYEFIDSLLPQLLEGQGSAQKLLGQSYIELHDARAAVETYFASYNRMRNKASALIDVFVGGRYLDAMVRRGDEWRIARRVVVFDWFRESAAYDYEAGLLGNKRNMGKVAPLDAVYELFSRMRAE